MLWLILTRTRVQLRRKQIRAEMKNGLQILNQIKEKLLERGKPSRSFRKKKQATALLAF